MKKTSLRSLIVIIPIFTAFILIIAVVAFSVGKSYRRDLNKATELGMKASDVKWLSRLGVISEEKVMEYNNKAAEGLSIEETNQLLDELLKGKEEEYLKKDTELSQKIQFYMDK